MLSVALKSENTGLLHKKVLIADIFCCFLDVSFFGPVFGRAFKNQTLSEKSDGLAALHTDVEGTEICDNVQSLVII